MKRFIQILLSAGVLLLASCSHDTPVAVKTDALNYAADFTIADCDTIQLQYFNKRSEMETGVAPALKRIDDPETIRQITSLLMQLPNEGDMMKKTGDVSVLEVLFYTTGVDPVYIRYYGNSLQTPATSFYSNHPKEEKALYELLKGILK